MHMRQLHQKRKKNVLKPLLNNRHSYVCFNIVIYIENFVHFVHEIMYRLKLIQICYTFRTLLRFLIYVLINKRWEEITHAKYWQDL